MKILFWTPYFWPKLGGLEVLATRLLPALRQRGHECVVVTSCDELESRERISAFAIDVHRFPFAEALARRDPSAVGHLRERLAALKRAFGPDVVHLHSAGPVAFFHLTTAHSSPCPMLLSLHTPLADERPGEDTVFVRAVRAASWVTAVSRAMLADVARAVPSVEGRSCVIHNGVPAPAVSPAPLSFAPPQVLYVGRLAEEKGVDLLLDAFAAVRARFPDARLAVAGDGPCRPSLEEQRATLGLRDVVTFLGWVDPEGTFELMNGATIIAVPSRYREPFALVAIEAGHMGRPVVAARTGGLEETVADGETGLLVEPGNGAALAAALCRLLEDRPAAVRMGEAARRRAAAEFGLEACADAYSTLYHRLAGAWPRDR
jgi:glycosyltransferase involved in cell wall biosynthesis